MTKEEIIEMARQAEFDEHHAKFDTRIKAFAKLVADAAVAKEREAILQMFEHAPALVDFAKNDQGGCLICGFTPEIAIKSIRARGGEA
jgi:hypothetical protein